MAESPSNIGGVCSEHAPKPDPQYFDKPMDFFIGGYVKLGFEVSKDKDFLAYVQQVRPGFKMPDREHMWVEVTGLSDVSTEELQGKVANDPIFAIEWPCGAEVAFKRTEIEVFTKKP
jgi:hypothetical protein